MTRALGIVAAGMVTGVGLSAQASCAAIRCGINNFSETRFMAGSGSWIVGSAVPLEVPWRGIEKSAKMAASAVRECLDALPKLANADVAIPLVLCIAEEDRPGRLAGLGGPLLFDVERELGIRLHPDSCVIAQGRVGGALGMHRAQKLLYDNRHPFVVIAGVDTYLTGRTLAAFSSANRLLTADNSNGFIPGEAAAAIVLKAVGQDAAAMVCAGIGFAREGATIASEQPLRADGMVEAVRAATGMAKIEFDAIDYRISDVSGEQYRFKEVALTTTRLLRKHKANFGLGHPADSVGEVGAASLLIMVGVLYWGARKSYLPGSVVLAHLSNDDDKRAALIFTAQGTG